MFLGYGFQGEVCVASSRVYVQEGIYDEFEKKLVEKAKAWVVGDPFDPKSQQGPQVINMHSVSLCSHFSILLLVKFILTRFLD